jgi:hypothetical protein
MHMNFFPRICFVNPKYGMHSLQHSASVVIGIPHSLRSENKMPCSWRLVEEILLVTPKRGPLNTYFSANPLYFCVHQEGIEVWRFNGMAAFCTCCGAEITLKAEALWPRRRIGLARLSTRSNQSVVLN